MTTCNCESFKSESSLRHLRLVSLTRILQDRWKKSPGAINWVTKEGASDVESIDHVLHEISYDEFFCSYIASNKPCVLGKWVTQNWRAKKEWVTQNSAGVDSINFDLLKQKFGESKVDVADCNIPYYNAHKKHEMRFDDFLSYMTTVIQGRAMQESAVVKCLYLKDWHFVREYPEYGPYRVPGYFASDWLNEYCDFKSKDDYKFVYMGPKGSWTSFHVDVANSFSWSANINGRKKWILIPPGGQENLRDSDGILPSDVRDILLENPAKCKFFEVFQDEGEVIFVPSGWHHQVHNLEDTISINHNWLNGANLHQIVRTVIHSANLVQEEIADCKSIMPPEEFYERCEEILKSESGFSMKELVLFLQCIAEKRISHASVCIRTQGSRSKTKCSKADQDMHQELISVLEGIIGVRLEDLTAEDNWSSYNSNNDDQTEMDGSCFNHTVFDLCMLSSVFEVLRCNRGELIDEELGRIIELILGDIMSCLCLVLQFYTKLG